MYNYRYINKHCQFGRTCYTLILEDLEGFMPTVRIEKEFNKIDTAIDKEFLFQEAKKDIIVAQQSYNDYLASTVVDEEPVGE